MAFREHSVPLIILRLLEFTSNNQQKTLLILLFSRPPVLHLTKHLAVWSLTMSVLNEGLLPFGCFPVNEGGEGLHRPNLNTGNFAMTSPKHNTPFCPLIPTLTKPQ